jgi:hypothetical protein
MNVSFVNIRVKRGQFIKLEMKQGRPSHDFIELSLIDFHKCGIVL